MSVSGFTDTFIRNLKGSPKQYDKFDGKIPGFGIRVSPKNAKSFFLTYRVGRKVCRLTFGRYPHLTLAEARKKALEARKEV